MTTSTTQSGGEAQREISEISLLTPEDEFVRSVYQSITSMAKPMETSVAWYLTGTAATVALLIANSDSVSKIVELKYLKLGLFSMTASLISGSVTKGFLTNILAHLNTTALLTSSLLSENGRRIMGQMKMTPEQLQPEIYKGFKWPITWFKKRAEKIGADPIGSDRSACQSLCVATRWMILQEACALIGVLLILVGLGVKH